MENYTITKQQILELHESNSPETRTQIAKMFPDAFKKELELNKWYKGSADFDSLIFITKLEKESYYNKIYYYGFVRGEFKTDYIANLSHENSLVEATPQEVEVMLIAEAKKRGYKKGTVIKNHQFHGIHVLEDIKIEYLDEPNGIYNDQGGSGIWLFMKGVWSEIIPEETKQITMDKAIKILSKKYGKKVEINL